MEYLGLLVWMLTGFILPNISNFYWFKDILDFKWIAVDVDTWVVDKDDAVTAAVSNVEDDSSPEQSGSESHIGKVTEIIQNMLKLWNSFNDTNITICNTCYQNM